ncbi:MAG: polyphosphate kinase 2 [Gammaproteobacteria bacterium]|nr:polyphosphate kinase 2 [Gammaproteobacteria bacterium]
MSEAVSTQLKKNNRTISTDSPVPEIIKDSILNDFPGINTKQDLLALITENKQLNKKIDQFEALHKKVIRKYQQAQELKPYQAELIKLQQCLEKSGKKMIIVFEGRGGAGKGGIIRRITQYMNAKHYRVVALGKPTDEIRSQWFFQKFIQEFPRAGEMVLFDRSWYTKAMIEPVFGFCTDKEYRDFIKGVGGFEKDLINQNTFIVKLYFSVSREEQVRRFAQREEDPLHRWKLSEVDLDAEEHWDEFTEAKYKMLRQTHTTHAPWKIIRSDNRHQARLNTMKVILNAVDYDQLDSNLDIIPDPNIVVSGTYEIERMGAKRLRTGKY